MSTENKPIVDYQNPRHVPPKVSSFKKFIQNLVIAILLFAILIAFILPQLGKSSPRAQRVKCASNLRQIGQAIQLYIADQKSLPDKAEKLITYSHLLPRCFVCPSTKDNETDSTQPVLKGHCSYVLLFENKPPEFLQAPADVILAYEDPKPHENEGANFLFADGHVEWYSKQHAKHMISEINAGHNPPRPIHSTSNPVK